MRVYYTAAQLREALRRIKAMGVPVSYYYLVRFNREVARDCAGKAGGRS